MALLATYDSIVSDDENAGGAAMGLLIFASFFAIPYFVFFRSKPKHKSENVKRKLTNRRCQNCSSTDFTSKEDGGIQCKHCGSIYN